jgi:hypothetical protein
MLSRMRLSIRLPLLIIVSESVVICIIILLSLFFIRSTVREAETAALTNSLKGYNSSIDFYLEEARSVLEITAQEKQIIDYSLPMSAPARTSRERSIEADVHKVAQSILKNSRLFEYLVLLNADGIVYILEPHQLQRELSRKDLAFTNWYNKLMKTGQTVTSDLHISPATQRPTVVIATPVRGPNGKIIGIWAGGINLDTLSQIGIPVSSPTCSLPSIWRSHRQPGSDNCPSE